METQLQNKWVLLTFAFLTIIFVLQKSSLHTFYTIIGGGLNIMVGQIDEWRTISSLIEWNIPNTYINIIYTYSHLWLI